jgi:alkylglycerol monooxygenase
MFGTFQEEEEHPTYGITKPINSWNPLFANVSHYVSMTEDLRQITGWKDKIKYLFMKPGWLPQSLGGYRPAPAVDKSTYKKYETPSGIALNLYVLFQYVVCLAGTAMFLFNAGKFDLFEKIFIAALIALMVVNCGVLFEQRTWVRFSEWFRIITYPLLLTVFAVWYEWSFAYIAVAIVYGAFSAFWFYSIQKRYAHLQMA